MINGYIALVIGQEPPSFRMVFFESIRSYKDTLSKLRKETGNVHQKIEVFRMVNGDTKIAEDSEQGLEE